ncbi:MAG: TlyA family RNA methyltransferase [Acidimicrobiales bacterium]|nr:TlyA family RNA methyltransferase [Acidimicrobiales bacterium]MDP6299362.1 TlyA family RNA methyltransferase [Acidimicrobiales bacterium]HJM28742.1 TlyA family RNA methyltransferase [Acidimicrobiales bacterium]HJM96663.1 TlyA family RNA methyltransferase [Acidimicrobiales bacterium]
MIDLRRLKVNGSFASKSSQLVLQSDSIEIETGHRKYVSRGGDKLEHALDVFGISPQGKNCIDVGASTGGFTDCLLQRRANSVTCVDVGYGLLHEKIRGDKRAINYERTNIRDSKAVIGDRTFDLLTADLSFISLKTVMRQILDLCHEESEILLLVKPQFESTKNEANKAKGVINNPEIWLRTLEEVTYSAKAFGGNLQNATASPILGRSGNKEFFLLFAKNFPSKKIDFASLI